MTSQPRARPMFVGLDRRGRSAGGVIPDRDTVAEFVERKFRQGWRYMKVTRAGEQVGGIDTSRQGTRHKRTWFGEV